MPLDAWFRAFNAWVQNLGAVGGLIFACAYVLATVLMLPASPLSIAASLIFGLAWGFVLVSVSATVGTAAASLVARHHVEKMVRRRPRFKSVDRAISEDGWKVVVLLRLSPLAPFNLQHYFYGLTDIRFWHYVVATFFGILPGVLCTSTSARLAAR